MKRFVYMLWAFCLFATDTKAEGNQSQVPLADPYILLDGDTYYAYGTNDANGIRCYTSDDLRTWKYEGLALHKDNTSEDKWFWAPEVYRVGDHYIMYFSANEHLFAATATSPKGPFKQVGSYQMESLIGDEKCIDSHVFFDTNTKGDTLAYVFFVRFNDGNCIWKAKLSDDFITPVEGTLRKCFAVSQDWENKMGRVNEGPNVIKYNRKYYLTYSGNDYQSQDYAVGYATTTNLATGTWSKYSSNPILRRWDDLVGTGHHSLFYDKEGLLRIVFHAHNSTTTIHPRLMYIGTMQFRSGNLVMLNDPIIRPTLSTTAPYQPELITKSWGFSGGGAVTIDLNNDGNQDIVADGYARAQDSATGEIVNTLVRHDFTFTATTHKWTKVSKSQPYQAFVAPSLIPCDINSDGNMDLLAFDQTCFETEDITEGIFLGGGNGSFEIADINLTYSPEWSMENGQWSMENGFNWKAPCNAEVIDIDNDGRLDVILVGHEEDRNYNVILHNQSDSGTMTFSVEPFEPDFFLCQAIIKAADLNNDGLQDFVISASVDGRDDQTVFTDIYLNSADQPGRFTRLGIGEKGADIKRKANGALHVCDFNGDGWLDIMLAGQGEASSGESGNRQRIYINQQTTVPSFKPVTNEFQTDVYTLSASATNSAGVIDWDGDGHYDVLLGGKKSNAYGGMLYINDGRGRLKRSVAIPGATDASIIFPDYNGDGRKDFLLIGHSEDKNYLTTEQFGDNAILCCNLFPTPSRPDAPLATAVEKLGNSVKLLWQPAETAKGTETYDIFIKDEEGNQLCGTPAIIGDAKDGLRKANLLGRAGSRNEWTFRPWKPGTYTWGVQAVDAAYAGSTFTEGPSFTVTEEDIASGLTQTSAFKGQTDEAIYNLAGQRMAKPRKGVSIVSGKKVLR